MHTFHSLYPAVHLEDIPFTEDCLGDQFILRDGRVHRLAAETGELQALDLGLAGFFHAVQTDPIEFLSLEPLLEFQRDGGTLEPGQLLASYPPFCTEQAAEGMHLAAVSTDERRRFLANLAALIRDVPEGGKIVFELGE